MDIELPSDDKSDNDSIFDGRLDLYEAYWLYVDGVRYVGPVLEQSEATKDDGRSPLARHYNHFYEKKEEHKEKCRDLPGSLPEYKNQFKEPRGEVRKIPEHELDDLGIEQSEGDDPIWLPSEYELPDVWDNNLDDMSAEKLKGIIKNLRKEKRELQNERDELQEQLGRVRQTLTSYLDDNQFDEDTKSDGSAYICDKCGRSFDSQAGRHGHRPHCNGSVESKKSDSNELEPKSTQEELADLADSLPEIQERQSNTTHEGLSPEEELENLNHLLQGSL